MTGPFLILPIISLILALFLGIVVFIKNPKSQINSRLKQKILELVDKVRELEGKLRGKGGNN